MTVGGVPIPDVADLAGMRRARHTKLADLLETAGLDALVLLGGGAVSYATGAANPGVDSGRAALLRPVAVVVRGERAPHLFTPYPEGAPPELPADHLHGPCYPELDEGVEAIGGWLAERLGPKARLAVDELTHALAGGLSRFEVTGAGAVMAAAKLCKTADELACIRTAQHINELAMTDVRPLLRPGVRQTELTARFLRRVFELGGATCAVDPIWQVMPASRAELPWTTHGDIAFPTPTTDRFLRDGDVIWIDAGITWEGYASDFGRTWLVGSDPTPTARQQAQCRRWREVVAAALACCRPGVTALELDRAAIAAHGGRRPWLEHFYLAHGVGTESAEMPLIGTDLGEEFDDQLVLRPGMVLVFEPVIWDEGAGGYRAEDMVAITDDGWAPLSDFPFDPFDGSP